MTKSMTFARLSDGGATLTSTNSWGVVANHFVVVSNCCAVDGRKTWREQEWMKIIDVQRTTHNVQ
ncbi:hypothetical protein AT15_07250 [Kosmotoga arenicorallina S304]|uniref:Uncharacterized protein n=1 Tax=Kosmotoga arenicorallina S304 TaxID=1453497 RepID=A0A182C733_9BACT|nr:hypothetical protein AT15_07250 [Kosmotoga arenicorallina S304]